MERCQGVDNPVVDAFHVLAFRHLDSLLQRGVDVGGHGASLGAEAHIAAAEGEAVVGTHNGAGNQFDGVFDLLQEVADDGNLLEVLFAEIGAVGLRQVEEAAHHHCHAREMARAAGSFHHLLDGAEVIDRIDGFGIHLLDGGDEGDVGFCGCELLAVGLHRAGVFGEVFLVIELYGVDKDADDHEVVFLAGTGDQGEVPLVERAHSGYEADGLL